MDDISPDVRLYIGRWFDFLEKVQCVCSWYNFFISHNFIICVYTHTHARFYYVAGNSYKATMKFDFRSLTSQRKLSCWASQFYNLCLYMYMIYYVVRKSYKVTLGIVLSRKATLLHFDGGICNNGVTASNGLMTTWL